MKITWEIFNAAAMQNVLKSTEFLGFYWKIYYNSSTQNCHLNVFFLFFIQTNVNTVFNTKRSPLRKLKDTGDIVTIPAGTTIAIIPSPLSE